MKSSLTIRGLAVLLILLAASMAAGRESGKIKALQVTSPAFQSNQTIPSKYGCDGINVNPPLRIGNVPAGTKSLALLFDDLDAPRKTYVHWILWNLPPSTTEIKENSVPEGAVQGLNDFKKNTYGGPCPPNRPHRYALIVFALDATLNLDPPSGKADLEKAMEGHILAEGRLVGVYKREKKKR